MIRFYTRILRLEERKELLRVWKEGNDTKTEERNIGWFMLLDGSWESLFVGMDKPQLEIGDQVEVVIKRRS